MNRLLKRLLKRFAAGLAASLLLALPAHAGRSCEQRAPDLAQVQQGLQLAEHTRAALDASGAQVVVLARAGQDLSRYGLRYSHLGLAYRDGDNAGGGWRVVHKLNHCGQNVADLWRQGLAQFFLDDPFEYRAGVVVLAPAVQVALLPLLQDNARLATLHTQAYNMLAYPWAQTYQQSNQWALETLAYAVEPTADTRQRAQAWLQFKGYQPTTLHLGPLTRLGASVSRANIRFDDHPNNKRFADRIETVTVDSVFDWLQRTGLGESLLGVN